MTIVEKSSYLRKNYLFERMPEKELDALAQTMQIKTIPAKTIIIEQDTLDTVVYYIVSGEVRIFRITDHGDEVPIAIKQQCELVGEMALFNNFKRTATVETTEDTLFLTMSAEQFLKILYTFPDIAIYLLQAFARQWTEFGAEVGTRIADTSIERTRAALIKFKDYKSNVHSSLSVDELSTIVGVTKYRMIDVLKDLEDEGKLQLKKEVVIF